MNLSVSAVGAPTKTGARDGSARRRSHRRDQRGVTIVEFALIAPLLFLIIMAMIDFGWVFMQDLSVKQAAREGGRLAIVDEGNSANCSTLISDIKSRVASDVSTSKLKVSLSVADTDGNGVTGDLGDVMTITVTYPRTSLTGMTTWLQGGNMSSTVQMRMEQTTTWGTSCSG
jgi:Flp pilus assembly protein TadG